MPIGAIIWRANQSLETPRIHSIFGNLVYSLHYLVHSISPVVKFLIYLYITILRVSCLARGILNQVTKGLAVLRALESRVTVVQHGYELQSISSRGSS